MEGYPYTFQTGKFLKCGNSSSALMGCQKWKLVFLENNLQTEVSLGHSIHSMSRNLTQAITFSFKKYNV